MGNTTQQVRSERDRVLGNLLVAIALDVQAHDTLRRQLHRGEVVVPGRARANEAHIRCQLEQIRWDRLLGCCEDGDDVIPLDPIGLLERYIDAVERLHANVHRPERIKNQHACHTTTSGKIVSIASARSRSSCEIPRGRCVVNSMRSVAPR